MHAPFKSLFKIVTWTKELVNGNETPSPRVVELTMTKLEAHFLFPIIKAADLLGVSLTSLKW